MHRHWMIAAIVLCTILVCFRQLALDPIEPVYAGKTVSQWLDAGYEDSLMALHEVGTPAFPYVMAKLVREDPERGSYHRYANVWQRCPQLMRGLLPKPHASAFDELRASSLLLALGPRIIPQLNSALNHSNPLVRETSARVLGAFYEQGKNLSRSKPFLLRALQDSDPGVRTQATRALGSKAGLELSQ